MFARAFLAYATQKLSRELLGVARAVKEHCCQARVIERGVFLVGFYANGPATDVMSLVPDITRDL